MTILARRHDCVAVTLADPLRDTLPQAGLVEMEDAETGEIFLADTSDARIRAAYHGAVQEEKRRLAEILRKSGVDQLALTAGEDYIRSLGAFLRRRENRR
jgi:uncharacterized protein (DUF58 family)